MTTNRPPVTLSHWLMRWNEDRQGVSDVRKHADRRRIQTYLLPFLGSYAVTSLSAQTLDEWVADQSEQGVGAYTLAAVLTCVRGALDQAYDEGLVASNVARTVTVPGAAAIQQVTERDVFTEDELHRLTSEMDLHYRALVLFSARTGARWEECLGIRDDDVFLDADMVRIGAIRITETRNTGSMIEREEEVGVPRLVPIPEDLLEALRAHMSLPTVSLPGYLFRTKQASTPPMRANFSRHEWRPAMERAGMDPKAKTFHNLRHTAAVNMLRKGLPLPTVSKYLGHSRVGTTKRIYRRFITNQNLVTEDDDNLSHLRETVSM